MDQGWAAVIAGVTGLVGAVSGAAVGGAAAVRGARSAAQTAAQEQHQQWVRQERRLAYGQVLAAYTAYTAAVDEEQRLLSRGTTPEVEARLSTLHGLRASCASLMLLAPSRVQDASLRLQQAIGRFDEAHADYGAAVCSGMAAEEIAEARAVMAAVRDTIADTYFDFQEACQGDLL
ncbi:hypothetical protein [Streptomyces sp. NPDC018031]|uniref:hypothetical protein n=1 Tax=Streptomyces sp. NPDC018031 TaxID=3365033 RepID=UPI00378F780E